MVSITFTQGATTCTIDASVVFGTDFWDDRKNQFSLETCDGTLLTYDTGPYVVHGVLVLKGLSYTHGANLYTFFKDSVKMQLNTFSISAIADLNLGTGVNTQVTNAKYDGGPSLKGLRELVPPRAWDFTIPYRFVRS